MKTLNFISFFLLFAICQSIAQNIQELPIRNDFELFYGTEIGNVYPGWSEGNGYGNPVSGESAWYLSNVLFGKAAGVSFSGNGYSEWLISPRFVVTINTKLSFDAALTRFYDDPALGHFGFDDSLTIMLSKDGINYETIFSFTQFSNLTAGMKPYEVYLGSFAGETINLAFFATDGAEPTGYAAFHMDNLVIKNAGVVDAAICSVKKPLWNTCLSDNTPVEITLKNDGTGILWDIPVRARVRGNLIENKYAVFQGPLDPGQTTVFNVGYFDFSIPGQYLLSVQTELQYDVDLFNNTTDTMLIVRDKLSTLPLPEMKFTEFYYDNLFELYGWREARGKNSPGAFIDTDWQGEMFGGSRAASVYFINLGTEDWLVGPIIECTPYTTVKFKAGIRPEIGDNMGGDDKFALMASLDCGENWVMVNAVTASNNLDTLYSAFEFSLAAFAGQQVRLAFYATTGNVQNFEKYLFYVDDILFSESFEKDLEIAEIMSPGNACSYSNAENLTVKIINRGRQDVVGFQASYILNGGNQVIETVNQVLLSGQVFNYTFGQSLNLFVDEINYLTVSVLWNPDQYLSNNQIINYKIQSKSFNLASQGTYLNGFEDTAFIDGWVVENTNNDVTAWTVLNNPEYAFQGSNSYFFSSNNSAVTSNDWLFSPCFHLQAGQNYIIKFYYRNRATSYPEKLRLKIGNSQHSSAMRQLIVDLGSITNSTYNLSQSNFSVPSSGSYYFGWQAYGPPDMFAMHIDNVEVYQLFNTDAKAVAIRVQRLKDQNCTIAGSDTLFIDILNQGTQSISNIPVSVKLNQMEASQLFFNQNLEAGQICTIKFPIHLTEDLTYNMQVWTSVENDYNVANDTVELNGFCLKDFEMGFEANENLNEWTQQNLAGSNIWNIMSDQSVSHSGTRCYGIRTDGAGGNTSNNDWLYSECFYLEAGKCYELSFFYRSRYSTENLGIYIGTSANSSSMNLLFALDSFNSNIYLSSDYVFGVQEDGIYYIGWNTQGSTSGRYWIYLDDIALKESNLSPIVEVVPHILDKEVYFSAYYQNVNEVNWDFGDGSTSAEFSPSHFYNQPGEYNVTLSAFNLCGQVYKNFSILINYSLEANFDYQSDSALLLCNATTEAVAYSWDFGDGNKAIGAQVENLYSAPGNYNVKLTSYTSYGIAENEKEIAIDFSDIPLLSNFEVQVYPNPVSDILKINSETKIFNYVLTDLCGKVYLSEEIIDRKSLFIDLKGYYQGIYFLKTVTAKGTTKFKILKK